jgi:endoglucanase
MGQRQWEENLPGRIRHRPQPGIVAELQAMIDFMAAHQDVFIGGTMFAGGGTWGRNPKSADPIDGVDKPQTMLLRQYFNR